MYRPCVPAVPDAWQRILLQGFFAARAIPAIPEPGQLCCPWEPELPVSCSAGREMQRKWETYAQQFAASAFLRCRSARESGAVKCAVLPDALHQAARSSAEVYQLRGWKTALSEIPALWVRDVPDLWNGHPYGGRWTAVPRRRIAGQKHDSAA